MSYLSGSRHPLASVANRRAGFPLLPIPVVMDSSIFDPGKYLLIVTSLVTTDKSLDVAIIL